jgi:hypothetical protein
MNPDQLRLILADALEGAVERLRASINVSGGGADAYIRESVTGVTCSIAVGSTDRNALGAQGRKVSFRAG